MQLSPATERPAPRRARMDDFTATMIAEGQMSPRDRAEYLEAWQYLVSTGLAYRLQGWFGRTAEAMIASGDIHR
jgi:hypothetical protein